MMVDSPSVPEAYRANFRHLYLDIGWFGLLSGSAMAFLSIYLVRIGASAYQIGLLNAAPALMAIGLALPAGSWLAGRAMDRAVFATSALHRLFYLVWIPLPALMFDAVEVNIVIAVTFLMSIPGTALAVGFNAMFAEAVPPEWRGHVVGIRNAVLAGVTIFASLVCGILLDSVVFPLNYQIVFGLGFIGAMMSSYHLYRIRLVGAPQPRVGRTLGDMARPGQVGTIAEAMRPAGAWRFLTRRGALKRPDLTVLKGRYGGVLLALFFFHLTQYLAIPLFPIYWVEELALADRSISLGNALFYATMFLGSTRLRWLIERFGSRGVTVIGALMMAAYPGLTAITRDVSLFLFTSVVGGAAWALAGGALSNYLLDQIPDNDRPAHLAWYMLVTNLAVLGGSLFGPALGRAFGLIPALFMIAVGRVMSGFGILRLGRKK